MTDDLFLFLMSIAALGLIVGLLGIVEWLYYKMFGSYQDDQDTL